MMPGVSLILQNNNTKINVNRKISILILKRSSCHAIEHCAKPLDQ